MENKFANKPNNGRIWLNRDKTGIQPDYSGTISLGGSDKSIALWSNTTKNGETYFGVKVDELRVKPEPDALGMLRSWSSSGHSEEMRKQMLDDKKEEAKVVESSQEKVVESPQEDDFSSDEIPF